jgi:hypothetical protein
MTALTAVPTVLKKLFLERRLKWSNALFVFQLWNPKTTTPKYWNVPIANANLSTCLIIALSPAPTYWAILKIPAIPVKS